MIQAIVYLIYSTMLIIGFVAFDGMPRSPIYDQFTEVFLVAAAGAAGFLLWIISDPHQLFADFTGSYYRASLVLEDPEKLRDIMGPEVHGLVNLPILAYLFAPLGLMPFPVAIGLFTLFAVTLTLTTWWWLAREAKLSVAEAGLFLFLIAAFGPLIYSLREGNASTFVLPILASAFVLLRRSRDLPAGMLLGAAALLKTPLLLLGVYFLLRRRWGVVAGGAVIGVAAVLLSLTFFSWQMHLDWYRICIEPNSKLIFSAYNSQSIWSAFARLERAGADDWTPRQLTTLSRLVVTAIFLAITGILLWLALKRNQHIGHDPGELTANDLEFFAVLIIAVIFSPLAWSHYYTWFILPIPFLFGPHRMGGNSRLAGIMSKTAIILTGLPIFLDMSWDSRLVQAAFVRVGVSLPLLGACLLLGVIVWELMRRAAAGAGFQRSAGMPRSG